jgi:hypothetical protein
MIPSPYKVHVHPYPTRFHGGIWTRPVFGLPFQPAPSAVFMPHQFAGDPAFGAVSATTGAIAIGAFIVGVAGAIFWVNRKK